MTFKSGTRLGACEIVAALGKAGWARCIARDPKLKREVAIKLLPEEFSRDHEHGNLTVVVNWLADQKK